MAIRADDQTGTVAFTSLSMSDMTPGAVRYAPLRITNAGSLAFGYAMSTAVAGSTPLASALRVGIKPRPERRQAGALRRAVLAGSWVLAGFGALCLALTVLAMALGARPVVVRTGSMAPALPVGTVAIVRTVPAATARVGDVVVLTRADGRRIMHRVATSRPAGADATTLVLKGDANRRADPPVTVSAVERPVVVVPWAGRAVAAIDDPWLQYWLGVLTGGIALAWLAQRRRRATAVSRCPLDGPR